MNSYKKLAVCFQASEWETTGRPGGWKYEDSLPVLAQQACNNGADQIWIWDSSRGDQEHEAVIGLIRETARAVDEPLAAGGHIRRLEDVKKYLYAGASAVFLNAEIPEHVDLIKEAADRFGSEKIYVCLPDPSYLMKIQEYVQLGACAMLLDFPVDQLEDGALDCLPEGISYLFTQAQPEGADASAWAQMLSGPLSRKDCQGAIVSLRPAALSWGMELKYQLAAREIPMDTFESPVPWQELKKDSQGLIPVVVQDYRTSQVLMVAYMNEEAFQTTLRTGRMTYYSRSRQCLWVKGETSGHFQYVKSLKLDCDNDTLLALVHQIGPACHTGSTSCFFQTLAQKDYRETNPLKVFENVYQVIQDRKIHPKEGSYTNYLFDKGIDKILKKLGEEATEIVIAAKNPNQEEIKYEIADFLYHMMVLMAQKHISWEEITEELANR